MSEPVTTTTTPSAPPAAPAPAAPTPAAPPAAAPPEAPSIPLSPKQAAKRAAREGVREDGRKAWEQLQAAGGEEGGAEASAEGGGKTRTPGKVDEHGRTHAREDGTYVPESKSEDGEATTPEAAAGEAAADGTIPPAESGEAGTQDGGEAPEQDEGTAAASEAAGGRVRVDLGDHPVAGSGTAAVNVADENEAKVVRALLNGTYERRAEVDRLRKQLSEVRSQLDAKEDEQIQREARQTVEERWKQQPEYKQIVEKYREILEEHGADSAAAYWDGKQSALRELVQQETDERMTAKQQEREQRAAQEWMVATRAELNVLPEHMLSIPEFDTWFAEEMTSFEVAADRGVYDAQLQGLSPAQQYGKLQQLFMARFAQRLKREPKIRAAYESQVKANGATPAPQPKVDEKAIAEKAVEDYKRSVAKSRETAPPHPLGGTGGEEPGLVSRTEPTPEEEGVDLAAMSPAQRKRYHREGARRDARAFASGG